MMFQQPHQQSAKFVPKPPVSSTVQPAVSADLQDDKGFRQPITFDGKRMRKAVMRKTVDYNSSVVKQIEVRYLTPVLCSNKNPHLTTIMQERRKCLKLFVQFYPYPRFL